MAGWIQEQHTFTQGNAVCDHCETRKYVFVLRQRHSRNYVIAHHNLFLLPVKTEVGLKNSRNVHNAGHLNDSAKILAYISRSPNLKTATL